MEHLWSKWEMMFFAIRVGGSNADSPLSCMARSGYYHFQRASCHPPSVPWTRKTNLLLFGEGGSVITTPLPPPFCAKISNSLIFEFSLLVSFFREGERRVAIFSSFSSPSLLRYLFLKGGGRISAAFICTECNKKRDYFPSSSVWEMQWTWSGARLRLMTGLVSPTKRSSVWRERWACNCSRPEIKVLISVADSDCKKTLETHS